MLTDWSLATITSRLPFVHYNSHENSTHQLSAVVAVDGNSSFSLEINHVKTMKSWRKFSIDYDMMPFPMRLLTKFNRRTSIPPHQIFTTQSGIYLMEHLWNNKPDQISEVKMSSELHQLLNAVRKQVGTEVLSCDHLNCTRKSNGDETCVCYKRLLNTETELMSRIHTTLRYGEDRTYSLPRCIFNCLHHHAKSDNSIEDQLEFYFSWSGYWKQLWKKPYLYSGYILATYYLIVFIQQTLNIYFQSAAIRGFSFVLIFCIFCVTMVMLIPTLLCGQLISLHYILHMADGCKTSMFVVRLSQASALIVTLLDPSILVTLMFIPVYFYIGDVLNYGKFHFKYFQLPEVQQSSDEDRNDDNTPPPYFDAVGEVQISMDCDANSLMMYNGYECEPRKTPLSKTIVQEVTVYHPIKQLLRGSSVMFNLVNLAFVCVLLYLVWV